MLGFLLEAVRRLSGSGHQNPTFAPVCVKMCGQRLSGGSTIRNRGIVDPYAVSNTIWPVSAPQHHERCVARDGCTSNTRLRTVKRGWFGEVGLH